MSDLPTPFDPCPSTDEAFQAALAYLRDEFTRRAEASDVDLGPDSFEELLNAKRSYLDGHLTRWSCEDLNAIYLEVFPAKVITGDPGAEMTEAATFLDFLDQTGLLDPGGDRVDELRTHLEAIRPDFVAAMADPSRHSAGKRLWSEAMAEGVALDDQVAVQAFIERFNERSFDQRQQVIGPAPPGRPSGRATPSGTPPRPTTAKRRKRR